MMYFASYLKEFFSTLTREWIIAIVAVVIILSVCMLYMKWKGRITGCKAISFVVLSAYILVVFAAAVFARNPDDVYHCELVLFWSYHAIIVHGKTTLIWENFWNILMLLPYGLLLPLVNPGKMVEKQKDAPITIVTGFLCTLTIELLQLIFKRGLFEFDDIFHNTLGVGIGYFLYKLFAGIHLKAETTS